MDDRMKQYKMIYTFNNGEIDSRLFFAWDRHDAINQADGWIYTYNETWKDTIILLSVESISLT